MLQSSLDDGNYLG